MKQIGLLSWALAAALPACALAATSGFITTRPTCVPPKYTPDALNYLQAPEPILLPSGDVAIVAGTGRCCTNGRHWEGLFSLTYPAEGKAAVPRFHPLWATNDFSRLPKRKEAEIGFPSALFSDGKWHIAMLTTFLPFHRPDRDRVGRIDLPDLMTRATTAQVFNNWLPPVNPKCRTIASCAGDGSGFGQVLTMHPNGDLYVYHSDGNYPACPSGYIRHRVGAGFKVVPEAVDACIRFEGQTAAPPLISDIARRGDGTLAMLTPNPNQLTQLEEWISDGDDSQIGRVWRPSGRAWDAPAHAMDGWIYYVRDAGYLKDATRTIVEPTVVVSQISDGRTFGELINVQLGRWYLYYWAEDGAPLPPTFGGAADACAYQGKLEAADCTTARGWAWDPRFPDSPISVDILVDGKKAATVAADQLRPGLGRGDDQHAFAWTLPPLLHDGRAHKITARFSETVDAMPGKPAALICP